MQRAAAAFAEAAQSLRLARDSRVAIALSGGVDSMALCHLASSYFDTVSTCTIDHRLRPESTVEAQLIGSWMQHAGIEHDIATIEWPAHMASSHSAIQERARELRYSLLAQHCAFHETDVLLTAHHEDDNIETFFFRLLRHSGMDGLASMGPMRVRKCFVPAMRVRSGAWRPAHVLGLRLCRPLLNATKNDLVAACRDAHVCWAEDPSNASLKYARNEVRSVLKDLFQQTSLRSSVLSAMKGIGVMRGHLEHQLAAAVSKYVSIDTRLGTALVDRGLFAAESPFLSSKLIVRLIQTLSGNSYPISSEQSAAIPQLLRLALQPTNAPPVKQTLGGCIVTVDRDRGVGITRQPPPRRHQHSAALARADGGLWWDGRFLIRLHPSLRREPGALRVRFMDAADCDALKAWTSVPRAVLLCLPAVSCPHMRLACVPHLDLTLCACAACTMEWCPASDVFSNDFSHLPSWCHPLDQRLLSVR